MAAARPAPGPAARPGTAAAAADLHGRMLISSDGVPLSASHTPPAAGAAGDLAFVVAHGFTGSWRRPASRAITATLSGSAGVVSFDFRGHGRSGGRSTVGDREVFDLQAAVGWARLLGYRRLVAVGWSMGAAVVIRHAALLGGLDAVVSVSGPSRWHYTGTPPMRRVHRGIVTRTGRAVAALAYRTRVAPFGWDPVPEPPDALAGRVSPTPLLVVHGDADPYFPLEHARWLVAAARPPVELWVEPGFGHAEVAAGSELVARIAAWGLRAAAAPPGASARIRG